MHRYFNNCDREKNNIKEIYPYIFKELLFDTLCYAAKYLLLSKNLAYKRNF